MVLSKYVREAFEASLEPLSLDPLEAPFDQENHRMKHHERDESAKNLRRGNRFYSLVSLEGERVGDSNGTGNYNGTSVWGRADKYFLFGFSARAASGLGNGGRV